MTPSKKPEKKLDLTEEEWRDKLSREEFYVLRKKGTEAAFSGEYHDNKETGTYVCKGCGTPLFSSEAKFDSGTGWPSFFEPVSKENVEFEKDTKLFYTRTEVHCPTCGCHLGHVFDDGPNPTGKRFCINSISLQFHPKKTST